MFKCFFRHDWSKWSPPTETKVSDCIPRRLQDAIVRNYYSQKQSKTCKRCGLIKSKEVK